MSQRELSKGICTQSVISKIERNEIKPSSKILTKIARRLKVDPNSFFEQQKNLSKTDIELLEDTIWGLKADRNYIALDKLLKMNSEIIDLHSNESTYYAAFFKWIYADLKYHLSGDIHSSLSLLDQIASTDLDETIGLLVKSSRAKLLNQLKKTDKAIQLYVEVLKNIDIYTPLRVKVAIYYNYSLALVDKNKYKESLRLVVESIDALIKQKSLYLLGNFYYQKGYILSDLKNYEDAFDAYQKALFIFQMENDEVMIAMTKLEIKDLNKMVKKDVNIIEKKEA